MSKKKRIEHLERTVESLERGLARANHRLDLIAEVLNKEKREEIS